MIYKEKELRPKEEAKVEVVHQEVLVEKTSAVEDHHIV